MTRTCAVALLAVLSVLAPSLAQPAKPRLQTISYGDLGKMVRANKGKVMLVYFWAHY
jgi:hypothetical protein